MGTGQHLDNGSGDSQVAVDAARIARKLNRLAKPMPNPVRFDPSAPPIDPMPPCPAPLLRDVNRSFISWKGCLAVVLLWECIAIFVLILPNVFTATPGWPVVLGAIMVLSGPTVLPVIGLAFMVFRLSINGRMIRQGEIPISVSRVAQLPPSVQAGTVIVGAVVGLRSIHPRSLRTR